MARLAVVAFAVGCAGHSAATPTTEIAQSPPRRVAITIARDTTYFLEPVRPDGTIDYAAALDAVYGKGLRPEDNAAIALFHAFGPDPFLLYDQANARKRLADVLTRLEMSSLPQSGPYFRTPDPSVMGDILKAMKSPWAGEEYPRVQAWLTANEGPLARVVEASRKPRLWFPRPKGSPIGSVPPFFSELRWAANALSARAMLQLRAGNMGASWTDVLGIHRLAALEAREGRLSSWLLAHGNRGTAHETAATVITQGNPDAASARAWLADLAGLSAFPASAEVADIVRTETLDLVSRLAVERSAKALKGWDVPAFAWDGVDWSVVLRTVNGWADRLAAIGRRPRGRARRGALQLWAQQAEAAGQAARKTLAPEAVKGTGRTAISRALGDVLSSLFISGSFVAVDDYSQLRGDMNRVALALAVYRADKGDYPVSLAVLAPRVLPRLPRDPLTGAALAYEREGAGYLLHSPGLDQKFDRERGGSGDDVVLRVR